MSEPLTDFLRSFSPANPPADAVLLQGGRNLTFRVDFSGRPIVIKYFPVPSPARALFNRLTHTRPKAIRAYEAARYLQEHCPGLTPEPLAVEMRPDGSSLFVTAFVPSLRSFRDLLTDLCHAHGPARDLIDLLQRIAQAVRRLHDSGFCHSDLGNQNLELTPDGRVMVMDLNRAHLFPNGLTPRQRARDLSRLTLPSNLLRMFLEQYWCGTPPPSFLRTRAFFRSLFSFHQRTHALRHPIRERKIRACGLLDGRAPCPPFQDIWIFDERAEAPLVTLLPNDPARPSSAARTLAAWFAILPRLRAVVRRARGARNGAFAHRIPSIAGRAFVSLSADPARFERELAALADLPAPGLHVRLYAHEPPETTAFKVEAVLRLRALGRVVAISLVQSRASVLDLSAWTAFCQRVLSALHGEVAWVEYLHAVDRIEWGCRTMHDFRALARVLSQLRRSFPDVAFLAPSVTGRASIFLAPTLRRLGRENHLAALPPLSGIAVALPDPPLPRSRALRRLRAFRAFTATFSEAVERHLVVTDFHTPFADADEAAAAAAAVRGLLLGLCSGHADAMVFRTLSSHGFGLLDPGDPPADAWRPRPAFHALRTFHDFLRHATFAAAPSRGVDGAWILRFEKPDGTRLAVAWSDGPAPRHAPTENELGFRPAAAADLLGAPVPVDTPLGPTPAYFSERPLVPAFENSPKQKGQP